MLFNSLTFVVFFAVVVSAYWMMNSWRGRKNLLVIASYIFYGAWNPPFAALLFATTALDFYLGRKMGKENDPGRRKVWLWLSVASNLSMLGFFKYGNFLLENFIRGACARRHRSSADLDLFLRSHSFYTFIRFYTLISTAGVRRRVAARFTLAVSFLHRCPGPIVRRGLLPQREQPQAPPSVSSGLDV